MENEYNVFKDISYKTNSHKVIFHETAKILSCLVSSIFVETLFVQNSMEISTWRRDVIFILGNGMRTTR